MLLRTCHPFHFPHENHTRYTYKTAFTRCKNYYGAATGSAGARAGPLMSISNNNESEQRSIDLATSDVERSIERREIELCIEIFTIMEAATIYQINMCTK